MANKYDRVKGAVSRKKGSLEERLLAKRSITSAGCWEFTGWLSNKGYGYIGKGSRSEGLVLCHRASYELFVAPIPDGMNVLHKCDNPKCFNPDHLFLGTQADNVRDMDSKNRRVNLYGSKSSNAKLTEEQVADIRARHIPRVNTKDLAEEFGVTLQYVGQLSNNKWRKNG